MPFLPTPLKQIGIGLIRAVAGLNTVLRGVQCTWYEQDGVIRINTAGMKQSDAPTLNISPRNGLIAVPIETDEGG